MPNDINYVFAPPCSQSVNITSSVSICANHSYQLPSGAIVINPEIYLDKIRNNAKSCDSIITTVDLSVFPVSFLNTEAHICSNQTYQLPSGTVVNAAGLYMDTLRSVSSCDSIIRTIHLLVNAVSSSNTIDSVYEGTPYLLPSGQTVYAAGVYQSILINTLGCDSMITTTLKLKNNVSCLKLKTAFSPNSDGINDYWILYKDACFQKLEVNVYNRYGSLVYHADNYKNDWKRKYKNKSLPDGTYYYIIKATYFDRREQLFKDNLTIIR